MAILIILLLAFAWISGLVVVHTTTRYVIGRELIDLNDETTIHKLKFEDGLSKLHTRVLDNLKFGISKSKPWKPSVSWDLDPKTKKDKAISEHDSDLSGLNPPLVIGQDDLRAAYTADKPLLHLERSSLTELDHWMLNDKVAETSAFWTGVRWRKIPPAMVENARREVKSRFHDNRCSATLAVPFPDHFYSQYPIFRKRVALVEVDITHLLAEMLQSSRAFVAIVEPGTHVPVLLPDGAPINGASVITPKLKENLDIFVSEYNKDRDVQRIGKRFPTRIATKPTLYQYATGQSSSYQWYEFNELFAMGLKSPVYVESDELLNEQVKMLRNDEHGAPQGEYGRLTEMLPPPGDPLRLVGTVTEKVPRIRMRASHSDALKTLKADVERIVPGVDWGPDLALSQLAIDVQAIVGPGAPQSADPQKTAARPAPPLLLLVRAAAEREISGAVEADLRALKRWTAAGTILALVASLGLAYYFTKPIRAMSTAAHKIGSLDLTQEAASAQAEELLRALPTNRTDESGQLANQFKYMIEQVLQANRSLRTKQTELQEATSNLDMKVRLKTRELDEKAQKAREANEAKSIFLATISHDMRQPLHIVFTNCALMRQSKMSGDQIESLDLILKNARRLQYLINDILDYQRLNSGSFDLIDLKVEATEIDPLLHDLARHFQDAVAEQGNELQVKCSASGKMLVDKPRLERVLVNLLSNACKFTRGSRIELSAREAESGKIEFRVRDEGQGMSTAQKAKVFQPLMSSRQRGQDGTGLGLYICKGLIEKMGGQIYFESEAGIGTTFHVVLPREFVVIGDTVAPTSMSSESIPSPSEKRRAADERLALVVDDEESSRSVLTRMLDNLGYETITANGGTQGLQLAREYVPDLITLDVIMPDQNGWDVLSQLKMDPITADIPVIVVTVTADEEKGNVLGADGFLAKPVSSSALSAVVKKSMRHDSSGEILIIDDDEDCRRDLRRLLESCEWRVIEASSGDDALDKLQKHLPDLAIIDLNMPHLNGFELIDILRSTQATQDLPVIVLSAVELSAEQRQRLDKTTSRYFGKGGLNLNALNNEITRLVHRHNREATVTILDESESSHGTPTRSR